MKFKVFCAPGDHRDDFQAVQNQLNAWSAQENPDIVDFRSSVTAMTDGKNQGRYILTVVVSYRPVGD